MVLENHHQGCYLFRCVKLANNLSLLRNAEYSCAIRVESTPQRSGHKVERLELKNQRLFLFLTFLSYLSVGEGHKTRKCHEYSFCLFCKTRFEAVLTRRLLHWMTSSAQSRILVHLMMTTATGFLTTNLQ